MSNIINGQAVQDLVIAIGLIGGTLLYYKSRLPRQTIKDQVSYIAAQEKRISDLERGRAEDMKAIATLEGQIQVYKELPLRELADGIKEVVKISKTNADSNQKILQTLKDSALIAASKDAGINVHSQHVDEQVIEKVTNK